jgi:LmbE family N-acetylglucosaminyl deacetylase
MPTDLTPAAGPLPPATWPEIEFGDGDRILVLAPHPDDESLATGGVIQRALAGGHPVHVVFLTLGDNNEWSFMVYRKRPEFLPWQVRAMGEVRHGEALAAARTLGLPPDSLTFLGYPDFGTLHIWCSHWGEASPLRSMLTRVTAVPYPDAYRKGAEYKGDEIVRDLADALREHRPTHVFVSHPADHNPDHASLYLFTQIALWELAGELHPQVHPFLVHYPRWPRPHGLAPGATIAPPEHLSRRCDWHALQLTGDEVSRKREALQAHQTQYGYCREYLESFIRTDELYGDFGVLPLAAAGGPGVSLGSEAGGPAMEPAEELEDEERERFVGVESHVVRLVDGSLELSIGLSRPLAREVTASLYCFGYRADRPFAGMPKLHVEVGEIRHRVADQERALPGDAVEVRREAHEIVIRVPLEAIGRPRRVLLSAATRFGDLPLSSQPWRILELATPEAG